MGKYIQLSRCYLDDKDMSDILSSHTFGTRFLLNLARSRGIFLSHKLPKDVIVRYLSRLGFSWRELLEIAEKVNSEDAVERPFIRRIEGLNDLDKVEQVVKEVQDERGSKFKEVYQIRKKSEAMYEVEVTYVELDTTKQKIFQRRQITDKIEIEKIGDRVDVRHPQNEACKKIANQLIERLQKLANKPLTARMVELTGIRDHTKRTEFFLAMMTKINNFRHIDVLDLKVGNRFPELEAKKTLNEAAAEEPHLNEETQDEAEIKSMVKQAALSGRGLLTSELYKKLRETGYYMSSAVWSAKETNGEERLVEFSAGFLKPVEATDFYCDVKRIYPRDDPADKKKTQGELFSMERPRLRRLIEAAAYESLAALQPPEEPPAKD